MRVPRAEIIDISKTSLISAMINASSNVRVFPSNYEKLTLMQVMHEEDGAIGLWVESPSGEKWKAFGDGRLPGKDAESTTTNFEQCRRALQQSVKEVHDAYVSKQVIPETQFAAWQHAPITEKISSHPGNHKPLIKVEGDKIYRRTGGEKSSSYTLTEGLIGSHSIPRITPGLKIKSIYSSITRSALLVCSKVSTHKLDEMINVTQKSSNVHMLL